MDEAKVDQSIQWFPRVAKDLGDLLKKETLILDATGRIIARERGWLQGTPLADSTPPPILPETPSDQTPPVPGPREIPPESTGSWRDRPPLL